MQHIHKYIRVILGGTRVVVKDGKKYIERCSGYPVYKCALSGCNHYLLRELVVGRVGLCWNCGQLMTMTTYSVTLKKPHHRECTKIKAETTA